MAKKQDKRLGDDPFERFLPQIQDSRKKKDNDVNSDVSKNVDKNSDDDVNKNKNTDKNINVDNDVNINNDVYDVVNNDNDSITDENINADVVEDDDININDSDDVSSDGAGIVDSATDSPVAAVNEGTITIPRRKPRAGDYTRATYYLRPDQINTINRLHKDSGRDKSELVRMAIDYLIKQARVE